MKSYLFSTLFLLGVLLAPFVAQHAEAFNLPGPVFAQVDAVPVDVAPAPASDISVIVSDVVNSAAQKWPWVTAVVMVMGAFRLVAKPIHGLIRSYIANSESKKDDEILNYVESSWWYKFLVNILNYLFSVNLKPPGVK